MVNNDVPLCKNCKHYILGREPGNPMSKTPGCDLEVQRQLKKIESKKWMDAVSGTVYRGEVTYESWCYRQRLPRWPMDVLVGKCGRRGRWFELKKPEVIPYCGPAEDDPNPDYLDQGGYDDL